MTVIWPVGRIYGDLAEELCYLGCDSMYAFTAWSAQGTLKMHLVSLSKNIFHLYCKKEK